MLSVASLAASAGGVSVCIAVVCPAGHMLGFLRVGEPYLVSYELAIDKAWTSSGMRMSSRELGEALLTMSASVREGLLRRPRLTEVPGGLPIRFGGHVLGGVGVSGGSDEQDEAIARAALAALEE